MFWPTHAVARMVGTHWPGCSGSRYLVADPTARKPANKAEQSAAEWVERRAGTKGNAMRRAPGLPGPASFPKIPSVAWDPHVRWTHRMIAVDACRPALVTPRNHMLLYERCYAVGSVTDGGPNVLG